MCIVIIFFFFSSFFMASFPFLSKCFPPKSETEMEEQRKSYQIYLDLTAGLPKYEDETNTAYRQYQGYWYLEGFIPSIMAAQRNIKARPGDIFLVSYPKCGTMWMKALVYSVCHRKDHDVDIKTPNPLLHFNPHQLYATFEVMYMNGSVPDLDLLQSPRLFATHLPYSQLPESVKDTPECRIVYVCREPKDNFVSVSLFSPTSETPPNPIWDIDMYCSDKLMYGTIWDHMLGYWKKSKEEEKVLFLKYEEVMGDTSGVVKRLGEFLGFPFSDQEVGDGAVEKIVELCSFDNLSNLEVNRVGKFDVGVGIVDNKVFFRRGKVGDWRNQLKPEMVERLDAITEEKLKGSGLTFKKTTTTTTTTMTPLS